MSESDPVDEPQRANGYGVELHEGELGWEVRILDPSRSVVWVRSCTGEAEGRTLASTVQQHVYWLSPGKFREYYKLEAGG